MNIWLLILIAMPFWILAWYVGKVILLNYQKRLGIFKHCIHCGKPTGDYFDEPEPDVEGQCNNRWASNRCTRELGHEGDHGIDMGWIILAPWPKDAE